MIESGQPEGTQGRPTTPAPRPSGSSMIAEMLSEREQLAGPAPGPGPGAGGTAPGGPRTGRRPAKRHSGRTGLIVAVVGIGVLLGGGAGVFLATTGVGLPSKTKFITKADAVCGPTNQSVAGLAKPTSYPELATAAGAVVTATDAQVKGLRGVKLPGGAAHDPAGAVVEALAATNRAAHSLLDAAGRKDDAATAAATQRMSTQFGDAGTKAKAFGFKSCAAGMQAEMDSLTGGSKGLVKTSFVAKSDNLCREAARKVTALALPKNDGRDIARFFNQAIPVVSKLLTDLKVLTVPPGDEAAVAEMMGAQEKVIANAVEMRDAASAGDQSRFLAASKQYSVLVTAADSKLDAYGLGVCGSNFGD